ncbi:hypothetical protein IPA_02330 [Ignicoccus pacificus DSM 13166]|uniref:Uncharacterized protein n=1 Tax=Ignicoccus pacificus DSM 13166 TaxID=940294 RepID=A0A977KAN6_9CREN|nr:hypothetical protein IPA_02330 [Ignicoccus pacificus DSM 13166]
MFRLEAPKEQFERLKEEFKDLYKRTYGREISDEELLEVLDGKKEIIPMTYNIAKALEELADVYWRLRAMGIKL